jgi:hypothetical protein
MNSAERKSHKKFKRRMRNKMLTRHHRLPRVHGGGDEPRNISWIPQGKHRAFHTIFGVMSPEEIAQVLTELYIDPDWQMIAIKKATP